MAKRILIVDDDPDIRDVAQIALQKFAGWETIAAASGPEGLERVRQDTFDAILLDVSMPDMDGFSVFEHLQADPATQTIPVLLLTAKVLPSDRQRFSQMGVTGLITKPFNPVTLPTEVATLLGWLDNG